MRTVLVNGVPGSGLDASDRGLAYGDGLFETIAVRRGNPRFLSHHFDRLLSGGERLGIPIPVAPLERDIAALIAGQLHGTLKLIVTRGVGQRGYRPPHHAAPARIAMFFPDVPDSGTPGAVSVIFCRTSIASSPATAGLKVLGRIENVLASQEWQDAGIWEGLMLDSEDSVICGTRTNLFIVRESIISTPDLRTAGVCGVMRRVVMDTAGKLGLPVLEGRVSREMLGAADEIFLTNALVGLRGVGDLAGTRYPAGPVAKTLATELHGLGVGEAVA